MDQRSAGGIGVSDTVHTRGASPRPAEDLPAGTVVGGYEIEAVAGRGGMGVVYRARDLKLGRTVALKLIGGARTEDADRRAQFIRESLTAASIEHPNVLPIYQAGDDDGRLYIAMRFVEGASLADLMADAPGGMPPGRVARIVARAADALDAAHSRRLVHRDVKPGNILIADPDGEEHVYLSDFGLTTGGDAVRGEGWTGTLAYLAPEQIRGETLDPRTDVYALGCVLFHALTGRAPFAGGDERAVLNAHLEARPPVPSELVPGLPPALDDVVRRAMAKRPEDRFRTAGEMGRAALAARYDVALLVAPGDRGAAEPLAAGLLASDVLPLVAVAGEPRAAEGIRASGACAVLVGRSGLGDWARDGLAAARAVADRDRAFRLVLVLLPGAPDPGDPALAYMADQPWVDLRAGAGDALAAADVVRALRGADVPAGLPADEGVAPYRGLEAFREEDAALYFGREQDVARVLERLRASRFVAVIGPSGSGKSSLVQAGLVPALRRDGAPTAGWRVMEVVPGARPLGALAAQLAHLPGAAAPSPADLGADERTLDMATARALEGRPADDRVLLVVDQLEEAFTLCQDAGERDAFLGNLVYAATIPGGRTVVVVTMRADFYHRLAEHPALRGMVASQQVLLGPLDARNLRRAIEEPARRCGLELEPGLTRRILTDVADRPGTLPLMEHVLLEIWQRRRGRMLTLEAYADSGGVEGALARRANAIYGAMPPERQAVARRVLLRLTQPGEGTEDTRRRATRAELVTQPGEEAEVDAVVGALAEARLLTTGTDEATGEPVVDVTHEALIRGWPELRGWINDSREQLRLERRLSTAATDWDAGGRDDGQLYRGAPLALWDGRDESDLNELERGFLATSRESVEAERATRRKRTRITIAALAAVAAVIAAIAVFAFIQRNDANDQRDTATSRQLAATSRLQLAADPEVGVLLAQQALRTANTADAQQALRQAADASAIRFALDPGDSPLRDAAFAPGGRRVVTGGDDGSLRFWTPGGEATAVPSEQQSVNAVEVSPDGRTVATAGADGTVRLWTADGAPLRVLRGHDGPVTSLAYGRRGAPLVSGGEDGTVRVWTTGGTMRVIRASGSAIQGVAVGPTGLIAAGGDDQSVRVWTADGRLLETLTGPTSAVQDIAFSPDGTKLAAGAGDFTVRVWQVGRTEPLFVRRGTQVGAVQRVEFSRDGSNIVTAGDDATVRIWSLSGTRLATLRGHQGPVYSARFDANGRFVVTAGGDGSARVWNWRQGLPLGRVTSAIDLPSDGGASFAPGDESILSAGIDGSLREWDGAGGSLVRRLGPVTTTGFVTAATVSRDASQFAAAIYGSDIVVRDVRGVAAPLRLAAGSQPVWSMDFSDDGRALLTTGQDGVVRLWNLASGRPTVIGRTGGPSYAADLSADGTTAVTGGEDGVVRTWDVASQRPRAALRGHEEAVLEVELSPDDSRVVSSSSDRSVRVWDLTSDRSLILRGHQGTTYADFGADGSRIVSTADDGTRVWDAVTGVPILEIPSPDREAYRATLSDDGTRIALQTFDGRIVLLSCEVCGSIDSVRALAAHRATRDLTDAERQAFPIGGGA